MIWHQNNWASEFPNSCIHRWPINLNYIMRGWVAWYLLWTGMRASAPLSVIINQTNDVISERQNSARCKHGFLQTAVSKKKSREKVNGNNKKKKGDRSPEIINVWVAAWRLERWACYWFNTGEVRSNTEVPLSKALNQSCGIVWWCDVIRAFLDSDHTFTRVKRPWRNSSFN